MRKEIVMILKNSVYLIVLFFSLTASNNCTEQSLKTDKKPTSETKITKKIEPIKTGAEVYFESLSKFSEGDRGGEMTVAAVVNQTSRVGEKHLIDKLLEEGFRLKKIFAPEHGFRGTADAGEKIIDGKDPKTGLPIVSLYGKNKKPTAEMMDGIDLVIFDIQDVGARFYTYISTMTYVMQACAENGVKFRVLDRPNPNGHYVDGPVLENGFESFVGLHQIPVVHGMTIGEYAKMVVGEGWLGEGLDLDLEIVSCENYDHKTPYLLPVKPSPNLPNQTSIYLYPSLCFFEGTVVSVGRGTETPFQIYGHPELKIGSYTFTPKPTAGAKYPKLEGKQCFGFGLMNARDLHENTQLNLSYLISAYQELKNIKQSFFNENLFFDKLAGTDKLRKQIEVGMTETEIRKTWKKDLTTFKKMRAKYLLYDDF